MQLGPEPGTPPANQRFPWRDGRSVILYATGVRHPRSWRLGGEVFTPYEEVTDLAVGPRLLVLGTRRGVFHLPRTAFADPAAPEALAVALRRRLALLPDGAERLARMDALRARARRPRRIGAAFALPLLCAALFAAEVRLGPRLSYAGSFVAALVEAGERYRIVTSQLLHAGLGHLVLNGLGLLALGALLERCLGSARLVFVLGASALGAGAASLAADYDFALGASGIVWGLMGGLLWLELRHGADLPATWRLPRRLFLVLVGVELAISVALPVVAAAAHLGGLLAGLAATAAVGRYALAGKPAGTPLLAVDAVLAAVLLGSLFVLGRVVAEGSPAYARTGSRLLRAGSVAPHLLNDFAWLVATEGNPRPEDLAVALELARRAVRATDRLDPNVLDTLAEVYFAAGEVDAAVETIDEAIALAPEEPYFREQRRRFLGERPPEDRPEPPRGPRRPGKPPQGAPGEGDGFTV